MAALSSGLAFDSDQWLSPNHPIEKQIEYLDEEFEEGESLFLIVPLEKNFFSIADVFPAIESFEKRLADLPGVIKSVSPLSAKVLVQQDETLQIRSFFSAFKTGAIKDVRQFQTLFASSPYYGKLLSADGKTMAIQMNLDTRNRAQQRDKLLESIEEEIGKSPFPAVLLAGDAALKAEINRNVRNEISPLLAAGAVVIAIFLIVFIRHIFQVAVLMGCLAIAILQSLATVNLLGHALTPVSLCLPLMVAVIVIADGLHIFSIWDGENAAGSRNPLRSTIRKTWFPCLVTSLTSAVGFGAFSISEIVPVNHFGIDAIVAIAVCYPVLVASIWGALWIFPTAMSLRPSKGEQKITAMTLRFSAKLSTQPGKTVFVFTIFSLLLAASLFYARTETNFLNVLFKKSSRISAAFGEADKKLGGSGSVEVLIDGQRADFFRKIENFNRLKKLVGSMNSHPLVNDAETYLMPISIVHRPLAKMGDSSLPVNSEELAQELLFLEFSRGEREKDLVSPYINFDFSMARMEVRTPNLGSSSLSSLIKFAREKSAEIFSDARIVVTGSGAYIHSLSRYVIATQIRSFALTLGMIGLFFIFIFGCRLGIAGVISNMFPVLVAGGSMSVLGVPFDFATILVAGVTLGLSVDDSVHFLHHYKMNMKEFPQAKDCTRKSLSIIARPVVLTSLLFCAALVVLCFSSLIVMIKFALFTMAGLAAAMLSALVFLPSLVEIFCGNSTSRA